jgi:hypothetical protein
MYNKREKTIISWIIIYVNMLMSLGKPKLKLPLDISKEIQR